jgi:hypothetical protein
MFATAKSPFFLFTEQRMGKYPWSSIVLSNVPMREYSEICELPSLTAQMPFLLWPLHSSNGLSKPVSVPLSFSAGIENIWMSCESSSETKSSLAARFASGETHDL